MRQQDRRGFCGEHCSGAATVQRQVAGSHPGKHTLVEQAYQRGITASVQQQPASGAAGQSRDNEVSTAHVHTAAECGLEGSGGTLPHLNTIVCLFGRHDVSGVSAHVGGPAEKACQDIGAQAYASGTAVAFSRAPDLHTAAHEAAHVVQQRGGVQLKAGVGTAGDDYERHADAVADRVVAGQSAESMLDAYAGTSAGSAQPVAQRKQVHGAAGPIVQRDGKHVPPRQPQNSLVDRLIELLTTTPPVAGVGDYDEAFAFLNGLSMADMLATMSGAADRGYLAPLLARSSAAGAYDRARLMSALYAVELARAAPSSVNHEQLNSAGVELDQIPRDQQLQVFEYILNRRGSSVSVTTLMEGVVAMHDGAPSAAGAVGGRPAAGGGVAAGGGAVAGGGAAAASTTAPSPIEPGPWAPPGEQPIPFYIGNEAHKGIAIEYQTAHPGDKVLANASPLSSMLSALTRLGRTTNTGALNDSELGLMPDLANLTRLHLYEIKPLAAQALGAAKATMYLGLFTRAGVAMTLGPMGEPGTSGGIPAPGGVYMFWSPEPGVIVYQYRRGRLVPVPVAEPEPVAVRRWRFELQPLTQQQQAAVTTMTLGTAMLFVMMLLLSPAGI